MKHSSLRFRNFLFVLMRVLTRCLGPQLEPVLNHISVTAQRKFAFQGHDSVD